MARILRGEIYWTDLQPVRGRRLTYALPENALPRELWVKISQIRTKPADRLGKRIAALSSEVLDQIVDGLLELVA